MRKDISRVISQRSKCVTYQDDKGYKKAQDHLDNDDLPRREGMKVRYFDRKDGGDYYSPLAGFLRNNVGRPWNILYSEIRRSLNLERKPDYWLLFTLIHNFVELAPMEVNFEGWKAPGYWGSDGRPILRYYVDPKTGLLQNSKEEWRRWSPRGAIETYHTQEWKIIRNVMYRKMKGRWYEIIFANVPKKYLETIWDYTNKRRDDFGIKDVVLDHNINAWNLFTLTQVHGERTCDNKLIPPNSKSRLKSIGCHVRSSYIYAKARRQLSHKEIRRLDLSDPVNISMPNIVR